MLTRRLTIVGVLVPERGRSTQFDADRPSAGRADGTSWWDVGKVAVPFAAPRVDGCRGQVPHDQDLVRRPRWPSRTLRRQGRASSRCLEDTITECLLSPCWSREWSQEWSQEPAEGHGDRRTLMSAIIALTCGNAHLSGPTGTAANGPCRSSNPTATASRRRHPCRSAACRGVAEGAPGPAWQQGRSRGSAVPAWDARALFTVAARTGFTASTRRCYEQVATAYADPVASSLLEIGWSEAMSWSSASGCSAS